MSATTMKPLTSKELLTGPAVRELIMLAGQWGVGKTSAIVSLAWYVENVLNPAATFYVLDTENKFKSCMRAFGADAPTRISYYKCETMNDVTENTIEVIKRYKPYDWVAIESMSRIWEKAQDLGYREITGQGKAAYMQRRREAEGKKLPVTPNPDHLWNIVKGAHDGAFLELLTQLDDLNVIVTTTIAKPPKPDAFIKESAYRKAVRVELGIDVGLEGAPRIPYSFESLALMEMKAGMVNCRVLRDNNSSKEQTRVEFDVPSKRDWAINFWANCRE